MPISYLLMLKGLAQAKIDIEPKSPYFLFLTWLSKIRNQEFRLYI